ncbi:MAG: hypothetical protein H8E48_07625 [Chloroflexi bacterium]|nr:hypothetical protein [Chloroflexota bacterium]
MPVNYAYTHQRPDGNRYLGGKGDLPNTKTLDISLAGQPRWLVSAPFKSGSIWVVVLEDGTTQAFMVADGQAAKTAISPAYIPSGGPPLLTVSGDEAYLIAAPSELASQLTHPVPLGDSGRLAFIESGGDLVVWKDGAESGRLPVDALPDARLLVDDQERVLLLTKPSTRYPHGIAGDKLEATEITLLATKPVLKVLTSIAISGQTVVEGVSPIWGDLNGDGQREIIVTQSDAEQGAQVVVYSESGDLIAAGPAVGRGNRWRHQLAVAPFGADGETELVEVLTPHIGGIAGFYQLNGSSLELVVQQDGVTSHPLGTRNLDMGLAGDLDGDGQPELVVFNQQFSVVTALRRTKDGIETAWQTPVGGKAATNLAAVDFGDEIILGVGREDGVLRIWLAR